MSAVRLLGTLELLLISLLVLLTAAQIMQRGNHVWISHILGVGRVYLTQLSHATQHHR